MSVRWRSASPGVSRTHGTEAIRGSFASARHPSSPIRPSPMSACRSRRAPRSKTESFAWTRASLRASPRPRSSSESPCDAVGDVQRHACREQVRRVEAEPEAIVGHGREQLLRVGRDRCDGAAGARHQLDQDPHVLALVHGEAEALRGRRSCRLPCLRSARTRVDHQQVHPERVAGVDGGDQELAGAPERGRVPRGDVPDVRQVRDARREAAGGQTFTEPLDLRIVVARRGPCPRVGDEDLDAVGAAERGLLDRTLDARVPAPDVGAQDHA